MCPALWSINIATCAYFFCAYLRSDVFSAHDAYQRMAEACPEALYVPRGAEKVLHIKTTQPVTVPKAIFLYTLRYARLSALFLVLYGAMFVYCWCLVRYVK